MTLTLDRITLHTVVHHSSTSTYVSNLIEIEETFCDRTDVRTYVRTYTMTGWLADWSLTALSTQCRSYCAFKVRLY